jgi:hypothetical protein
MQIIDQTSLEWNLYISVIGWACDSEEWGMSVT